MRFKNYLDRAGITATNVRDRVRDRIGYASRRFHRNFIEDYKRGIAVVAGGAAAGAASKYAFFWPNEYLPLAIIVGAVAGYYLYEFFTKE